MRCGPGNKRGVAPCEYRRVTTIVGHLAALLVLCLACSDSGRPSGAGTGGAPEDEPGPDAAAGRGGGAGRGGAGGADAAADLPVILDAGGNTDSAERPDQRPPTGAPDLGRDLSAPEAGSSPGQALHDYVFSVE